jgi:hypothetical protein
LSQQGHNGTSAAVLIILFMVHPVCLFFILFFHFFLLLVSTATDGRVRLSNMKMRNEKPLTR